MKRRVWLITLITLIAAFALLLPAALLLTKRPDDKMIERVLEEKLQSRVSIHLEDVPLEEVYRWLTEETGLPLEMTPAFHEKVWPEMAAKRVTFQLENIRLFDLLKIFESEVFQLRESFRMVDEPPLLDFQEEKSVLMVSPMDRPQQVGRLQPIPIGLSPGVFSDGKLPATISRIVKPESWVETGSGSGRIETLGTALLVKNRREVQQSVADLLDGLRRLGGRPGDTEPILVNGSPDDEKIWRILKEPTDLLCEDRTYTLRRLCEAIRRRHGINVHVCCSDNVRRNKLLDQPLQLRLGRVRLESVLEHLWYQPIPYKFEIKNGTLWLADVAGYCWNEDVYKLRLYPIGDLIENEVDRREFRELVQEMIDPEGWLNNAGEAAMLQVGDVLVVRDGYQKHRRIEQLLDGLRYCRVARPRRWVVEPPSKTTSWLRRQLCQPLPEPLVGSTEPPISLGQLVERLQRRYGLNVAVNHSGINEIRYPEFVFPPPRPEETLGDYLTRELARYDLIWYLNDEAIIIDTPGDGGEYSLSVQLYRAWPMVDWALPLLADNRKGLCFSAMIEQVVDPDNEMAYGYEEGEIKYYEGYFVVRRRGRMHAEIARLQDALAADDLHDYDRRVMEYLRNTVLAEEDTASEPADPTYYQVADLAEYYRFEHPWQLWLGRPDYHYRISVTQAQQRSLAPQPPLVFFVDAVLHGEGVLFDYTEVGKNATGGPAVPETSDLTTRILLGGSVLRWDWATGRPFCWADARTARSVGKTIDYLLGATDRLPPPGDLFGPRSRETVELLLDRMLDADASPGERAYADFLLCGYLYAIPEAGEILQARLRADDAVDHPDRFTLLCRLIAVTGSFDEKMLPVLQDVWRLSEKQIRVEILSVLRENPGSPNTAAVLESMLNDLSVDEMLFLGLDPWEPWSDFETMKVVYQCPAFSDELLEKILLAVPQSRVGSNFRNRTIRILFRFDPTGDRVRAVYDRWMAGPDELRDSARQLKEWLPAMFDEKD